MKRLLLVSLQIVPAIIGSGCRHEDQQRVEQQHVRSDLPQLVHAAASLKTAEGIDWAALTEEAHKPEADYTLLTRLDAQDVSETAEKLFASKYPEPQDNVD